MKEDCSMGKFDREDLEFGFKCVEFQTFLKFALEVLHFYNLFFCALPIKIFSHVFIFY